MTNIATVVIRVPGIQGPVGPPTPFPSQAEAEGGVNNTTAMTPLRTKQQIDARLATELEAEAGTSATKLLTPLRGMDLITARGKEAAFTPSGTGAVATTVNSELRNRAPRPVDFMTGSLRNAVEAQSVTNDDAADIKIAMDKAATAAAEHPTRTLDLGPGLLWVDATFVIPSAVNRIDGAGKYRTTVKLGNAVNDYVIRANAVDKKHLRHFSVDGNFANNPTGLSGAYILECEDIDFEHVQFRDTGGSGLFTSAGGNFNPSTSARVRLSYCEALDTGGNAAADARTAFNLNGDDIITLMCRALRSGGGGFKTTGKRIRHIAPYSQGHSGNAYSSDFNTPGQSEIIMFSPIGLDCDDNAYFFSNETTNIELHSPIGRGCGGAGILLLNNVFRLKLFGGDLRNNGQDTGRPVGRRSGIAVSNTATSPNDITILGTTITDDQGVKTQQHAVYVEKSDGSASNLEKLTIGGGADLRGNAVSPLHISTTGADIQIDASTRGLAQVHSLTASTVTGTTTRTDHQVRSIPAYELDRRAGLKILTVGTITGSAGSKSVRLELGASTILLINANSTGDFVIEAEFWWVGTSAVRGWVRTKLGTVIDSVSRQVLTIDATAGFDVKLTTQLADAADSVQQNIWRVERLSGLT
jgi:hypothetical protein